MHRVISRTRFIKIMVNQQLESAWLALLISKAINLMIVRKVRIGIKQALKASQKIIVNVSIDPSLYLKMGQDTKGNGKVMLDMVMVLKYGLTVLSMKVIGKIIKHMEEVYFGMFTVINTKVNGKETKHMVLENILTVMELLMKETGVMIFSMVKV